MELFARRARPEDKEQIKELADKFDFVLPDKWLDSAVIYDETGRIIAFGVIRAIIEAVIVTNRNGKELVQATDHLIKIGMLDAHNRGFDQIHCFVENESFARLLKDRFDFKPIKGEGLVFKME